MYSNEMVELIQSKLETLQRLISQNDQEELPEGSMVEIIEKLNKKSHKNKNFDKHKFLKEVKYGHQDKIRKTYQDNVVEYPEEEKKEEESQSSSDDQIDSSSAQQKETKVLTIPQKYDYLKLLQPG